LHQSLPRQAREWFPAETPEGRLFPAGFCLQRQLSPAAHGRDVLISEVRGIRGVLTASINGFGSTDPLKMYSLSWPLPLPIHRKKRR